jgi:hypothetical protein
MMLGVSVKADRSAARYQVCEALIFPKAESHISTPRSRSATPEGPHHSKVQWKGVGVAIHEQDYLYSSSRWREHVRFCLFSTDGHSRSISFLFRRIPLRRLILFPLSYIFLRMLHVYLDIVVTEDFAICGCSGYNDFWYFLWNIVL